jgi:diaminohydroxyphosphoribosylaminopyrimidine deaminase / 5-amino-6-(5-phosphoribosylamino)uracil reductase
MLHGATHNMISSAVPQSGGVPEAAWDEADRAMMRQAIGVAWGGAGRTGANPMVGAVVVTDGGVVGEAFHRQAGIAHAERVALDIAGERARGGTLYASLEPCSHHGRTPPCVDRIVESGVARVVVAAPDPDARVRGRGIAALRARGIQVDVGCLVESALLDNLAYVRDRLAPGPTVTLKIALSADGMVARARGRRDDVTGVEARRDVHLLRAAHDAVVVGVETALVDDPRLDCRLLAASPDRDPVPVVLDSNLRLPPDNAWSRAGREYIVVAGPDADSGRAQRLQGGGGRVVRVAGGATGGVDIRAAFEALNAMGLARILVEGGPRVFASVVDAGCWDALWTYRAPVSFGRDGVALGRSPDELGRRVDIDRIGNDERVRAINPPRVDPLLERLRALVGW